MNRWWSSLISLISLIFLISLISLASLNTRLTALIIIEIITGWFDLIWFDLICFNLVWFGVGWWVLSSTKCKEAVSEWLQECCGNYISWPSSQGQIYSYIHRGMEGKLPSSSFFHLATSNVPPATFSKLPNHHGI